MPAAQKHMPKTDSDLNQVYIKRLPLVNNERQPYLVSLDVEINPRFYRGIVNERSDNRKGELDASRKTLKREEPPV